MSKSNLAGVIFLTLVATLFFCAIWFVRGYGTDCPAYGKENNVQVRNDNFFHVCFFKNTDQYWTMTP